MHVDGVKKSMRLNQKKQILELITTIEEGTDYVINRGASNTTEMMQDCINSLVFFADLMKEEQKVRSLIENAIHNFELFIDGKGTDLLLKKVKKAIKDIRLYIINDVKTEIEIAFMPYKSSMWDSLESIYREAKNDPNCTCYVVPIPYYEKNEQGEFIKFCYEGNEFPEDIDITLFEMYDFENRRPDIIYIHNPFDNYNKLTMVNPRFFSENLAQYTDMLAYVPYYVAGSSENKKMNLLPAYKNATKIIVQSNNTKEGYISNGIEPHKIMNLGSPKLDAMIIAKSEQKEIPFYWEQVIKGKHVILFNTGIADLLSVDTWFEQTEQVLNSFMDYEQCAFIWRPHPLTEITIKTMRPHLWATFEKLVSKLKRSPNIIIDNSSDIYPAVTVSDGIISDYSSVMLQYIITGKPVLGLLSEDMSKQDRYYYSDYLGCYFVNQDVTVSQFVDMVERNEDLKKEDRVSRFKKSISNADGTCGKKIHHSIKSEVMQQLSNV
ncbi:CDP-Glycerol:Poly(glycerophosphate) glycerophosphotransferase [Paenibacillus sp. cl6col]|uniref:CDP-glycerol glycerophosphotransferase family protein n=1 Tax=Paenibacillus sp. cl6col TaxID=1761878 RepID=UPI000882E56F|nr:CDP-glycerol glycerophosphotransferase family protein [Paenibacillus sp. cl6col]SDF25220.1 CDP-Glycerol:Poly(glycerophosphate) glycerophosphotransferase [Paenibacillus sp. cl6col]